MGEERAPIVLSGEEQARVNAAMARGSVHFLDGVLHGASGADGADVQYGPLSATDSRQDAREGGCGPSPSQTTHRTIGRLFNRVRKEVVGRDRACASVVKKGLLNRRFGRGKR